MKKIKTSARVFNVLKIMGLIILLVFALMMLVVSCDSPEPQPSQNEYNWTFKSGIVSGSFTTEGDIDSMTVVSGEFVIDVEKFTINEQIGVSKVELRLEHDDNLLVFSNPRFNKELTTITCDAYVYDTDNIRLKYVPDTVIITRK